MSDAGIHDATTIFVDYVAGYGVGHGVPVAGREVRPQGLVRSTCRVFQPWTPDA